MTGEAGTFPGRLEVERRLGEAGLSAEAAARAAEGFRRAFGRLRQALPTSGGEPPGSVRVAGFWVPGRIEVLGKHVDYAGGRSLLAAVERGFAVVASRSSVPILHAVDVEGGGSAVLPLRPDLHSGPGWELYAATVARRVSRDFPGTGAAAPSGALVAFSSDLPAAAGLASSSALVAALFLGTATVLRLERHVAYRRAFGDRNLLSDRANREKLASFLAAVEAGRPYPGLGPPEGSVGVGTEGGSEDHAAVLCAPAGHLVAYRFLPTAFEGAWPLPRGWTFAVASSGVRAEKAAGAREAYNRLSADAARAAALWREATGGRELHLGAILEGGPPARDRLGALLETAGEVRLLARARQFAEECGTLVPAAARAIAAGDAGALGEAARRSQALAESVLGNQLPETVELVTSARSLGAPAASAFGAGFGGAVWALVPAEAAAGFLDGWRARYLERFPARAGASTFLTTGAGPAAFRAF